jgi:hypothetical protein
VEQPAQSVRRYDRAVFRWHGGDPSIDVVRGKPFVSLQRLEGGGWQTVGTDDGPADTTANDRTSSTWTETWQFSRCDPAGTYRFHVTGNASRALLTPAAPYVLDSDPFQLSPTAPLEIIDAAVSGTTAIVRARYPDPGEALLALPRRVRTGTALLSVRTPGGGVRQITAAPGPGGLSFTAQVPAGSAIEGIRVEDGCGNTTG